MADVCLYLSKKDFKYCSQLTNSVGSSCNWYNDPISKESYINYIKHFDDEYVNLEWKVLDKNGDVLINNIDLHMKKMLNDYFKNNNIKLKAKSCRVENSIINTDNGLEFFELGTRERRIHDLIKKDIPAIIAIGPSGGSLNGKKGIDFLEYKELLSEQLGEPEYIKYDTVDSHYVTVTAVIYDHIKEESNPEESVMYQISTWGKEMYIYEYDYIEYIKLGVNNPILNNSYFNNVIYITEE